MSHGSNPGRREGDRGREGGREGRREGGREGRREGGREGGREREGGRKGGEGKWREKAKAGRRTGQEGECVVNTIIVHTYYSCNYFVGSCGPTHPSHHMISTTSASRYGPLRIWLLSNFQQMYIYMYMSLHQLEWVEWKGEFASVITQVN